jgi:hypothetical protein
MESHAAKQHSSGEHHQTGLLHEISTIQVKPVIIFALILAFTALATFATVKILLDYMNFNYTRVDPQLSPLAKPEELPPAPRLQVSSGQDLLELRAREATALNGYRWVNKDLGVVGIPVERAIELLAQRGLPVREEAKSAQ